MRDRPPEERKHHPWEQDPDGDALSFGSWLRQQRQMRGISLREIATVSKISIRYLEALESSRFSVLPAQVFAKGFLRQYAAYVGLDPDEVVNYYIVAQQEAPVDDSEPAGGSRMHTSTHWAYGFFLTAGIVLLFGVVALLSFLAERRTGTPETPPPIAAPVFEAVPAVEAFPDEAPPAPLRVTLDFVQDSWVEATVDDESRISELRSLGESLQLDAESLVVLTLGNPRGVRMQVNGVDRELPDADSVEDLEIRLESGETPDLEAFGLPVDDGAEDVEGALVGEEPPAEDP